MYVYTHCFHTLHFTFLTVPYLSTPDIGIQITQCKESNAVSSKSGAVIILRGVLGRSVLPEDILEADEPIIAETVIAATHVKATGDVVVEPDVIKEAKKGEAERAIIDN